MEKKNFDGINHIKFLSVREEQGAKIIKKLINREVQVVLDPTLLLSKEEWCKVQKKPKKMIKEKYILKNKGLVNENYKFLKKYYKVIYKDKIKFLQGRISTITTD